MYRNLLIAFIAVIAVACGGRNGRMKAEDNTRLQTRVFLPAIAPAGLDAAGKRDHLRWHYWDRFDFADSLFVAEVDTMQMVEAYVGFISLLAQRADDPAPMDSLMRRAAVSRPMLEYFTMLAEKVLADPNSPFRNDEFYIPVLEQVIASPFFSEWEKVAPAHDLRIARQNRIGHRANDFRYTLAGGVSSNLYAVKAEYVLLFINNPGCPMCREIRESIAASPMLNEMIERGRLKIVAVFPDEDLSEWYKYREQIPRIWINGYDKGCVIREKELYDLRAIPALYLFDRDKVVLVKDATDISYVEEVIDRRS